MSLWSRVRSWFGAPDDQGATSASGDDPREVDSPAQQRAQQPLGPHGEAPDGYTDPELPVDPSRPDREAAGRDDPTAGNGA